MGDRRQIHFEDMGIWYYTHWGGSTLIDDLQHALHCAEPRWKDKPYCFRIILSILIGKDWNKETGHGLDNQFMDSEYNDNPVVNISTNTVLLNGTEYSFSDFINIQHKVEK